jgi:hypothetical protein
MENQSLKGRITAELESLISRSCKRGKRPGNFRNLHQLLVKKHYNAADVAIDYKRKRVIMEVVLNDQHYEPGKPNINLPTLRVNLMFGNLKEFLRSCIETDNNSLAFYAWVLRTYSRKEIPMTLV